MNVIMNVDHPTGAVTAPSIGSKMVFTKCGTDGANVGVNWKERGR
jgi:hypothetical protein